MRHALLNALLIASSATAADLNLVTWNVQSEDNDPATIAEELKALPRQHVYCLQEVSGTNFGRYYEAIRERHGQDYRFIASNTGGSDRLMVVFDTGRLELQSSSELFQFGDFVLNDWGHRSPLVLHLKDISSCKEFRLVTVHLARGSRRKRKEQATGLREWAKALGGPAILMGDCNFDYSYRTNRGNPAFDAFTAEGSPWRWVRPAVDVDTNWSDRDGDGKDNYPDSCLDFCFVAGAGMGSATAEVLVRPGDFPADDFASDHRPVLLTVGD